jgi:hypothetical protein
MLLGIKAQACETTTIDSIVDNIDPHQTSQVDQATAVALNAFTLCDENLNYAGAALGHSFDSHEQGSTYRMTTVIAQNAKSISPEIKEGLVPALIDELDLHDYYSTAYILQLIEILIDKNSSLARKAALQLLSTQDPHAYSNNLLIATVTRLQKIAVQTPTPETGGSSIWAFRSRNTPCDDVTGPWGRYQLCPKYSASVADKYGNQIVLTCSSERYGIDFRVKFASSVWSKLSDANIETLAFGTNGTNQSMGVPYVIREDRALLASEPVSDEVMGKLLGANAADIYIRANSGEKNVGLRFTLKGSGKAIKKLMQYCE